MAQASTTSFELFVYSGRQVQHWARECAHRTLPTVGIFSQQAQMGSFRRPCVWRNMGGLLTSQAPASHKENAQACADGTSRLKRLCTFYRASALGR